tara:strand:+ start:4044 stop:4268 length:225 start_codon:yes stop_codon:yes gene_type:complete
MSTKDDIKYDVKKDLNMKLEKPVLKRSVGGYMDNNQKFVEFGRNTDYLDNLNDKFKTVRNMNLTTNNSENSIGK